MVQSFHMGRYNYLSGPRAHHELYFNKSQIFAGIVENQVRKLKEELRNSHFKEATMQHYIRIVRTNHSPHEKKTFFPWINPVFLSIYIL